MLASIAALFLFSAFARTFAQKGVGAKYGARDPRSCADTKAPARGAMTAALATKYVICSSEGVKSDYLYLVEGITTVQVGGGVPYNPRTYPYATDIDTKALIYPFRAGAYKSYQCAAVAATSDNKGYNCNIYPYPNANGVCMKTTFGDWSCTLSYQSVERSQIENNVPPPTGAKGGATDKPNAAAKNGVQTAAAKAGADDNKGENGLPPPDFSEMEKYFEIVRYEYTAADHTLNLALKMTKQTNVCEWEINFYDADGVKVVSQSSVVGNATCSPELGEPTKAYANLPPESKWKFVKKLVITTHIY